MKRLSLFLSVIFIVSSSCQKKATEGNSTTKAALHIEKQAEGLAVLVGNQPLLMQAAKDDFRPFLHPIHAPDGKGILTEYSPGHHKHQTGLYWGFTRVNGEVVDPDTILRTFYSREKTPEQQAMTGRDFFHHPTDGYWKKLGLEVLQQEGDKVQWKTEYHMLDAAGEPMMKEIQTWSAHVENGSTVLDLDWEGKALRDIRIGAFDYGGMFLRMPWRKEIEGAAVNSEGLANEEAEGKKAKWVDVGMQIEGRDDWGHIVIMDHPENANHPTPWRVDGQLGIGPCRAIEGDWEIAEGNTERMRFRLLVYTGELSREVIDGVWAGMSE